MYYKYTLVNHCPRYLEDNLTEPPSVERSIKKLDGVAPLMTDPPPTSSTTQQN